MNNIFTTTGIKNIQSGDRIYFIDDNIRMSSTTIDKIDTFHYNTYYKISTHSGNIICGDDFNVYTCNLCNFNDNYGYDKVITTKKPSDLSIGDLLLTPYFGVSKRTSNENILIDILPIVEDIITNHEKYDKYKVSYDDLTISILCPNGKKTSPMLRRVNIKSLLEIMAWYITEGWCSNQWMKNKSASRFNASLSQSLYKNFENSTAELWAEPTGKPKIPALLREVETDVKQLYLKENCIGEIRLKYEIGTQSKMKNYIKK